MRGEIVRDGATGQAIVAATGTPVDSILEALESGDSREAVLKAHPGLTLEDLVAAVRFARAAVERHSQTPLSPRLLHTYADVDRSLLAARREREHLTYRLNLMERVRDGLAPRASGEAVPHAEVFATPGE